MRKERITLDDSIQNASIKLSEGNPGSVTVILSLFRQSTEVDPDSALMGFGSLLTLDTLGIYGDRIWMLYKDVCQQNTSKTICVLRAVQLGIISEKTLNNAIDNYGEGIDLEDVILKVKNELPDFNIKES